jgi:tetratricopeptide (TPR) repeat protein
MVGRGARTLAGFRRGVSKLWRRGAPLLISVTAGLGAAGQIESASSRCARAVERGQWREARDACHESHVGQGNAADVILLARAELQVGNSKEAERLATGALEGPLRAQALAVVGVLRDRAGDREGAHAALREAIASFQARGETRELARAWFALAGSFWRDRRLSETLDALDEALAAAEMAGDRRLKGLTTLMRGDVMRSVGDARSAEREYELAASQLEGRTADLAYVDLKLGILRQEADMLNVADIAFQRALARAEETGSQDAASAARQNLAYSAHLAGNPEAGFAYLADWKGPYDFSYHSIVAMLEADAGKLEQALASMDRALSLSRGNDAWWGEYERARIRERLGDDAGAELGYERSIAIVERMRAAMDQTELQAWMIARRRRPYEALLALFVRQGRTEQAMRVLEAFSARSFMDAVIANGSLVAPARDALDVASTWRRLEDAAGSPDDLGAGLAGREVVVPVEVLGRLYVAYKPAHGRMSFIDRGDAAHTRDLATRFAANPDATDLAAELGRILIPEEVGAGSGTLHIVASGWLAAVPYAALRRGDSFLVEQRPLAIMPSLRAFSVQGSDHPTKRRLVIADADGTLPSARVEATEIARALGTNAAVAEEATSLLVETAGPLELLHLGVHAGLDGGGAWLSMADGRWSTDAIMDSGVSAQVVILAACSSAATHHEEVWGSLATAFLANGSGSVIASLGSIGDDDTRSVMRALYQGDLVRQPVRALADAQRSALGRLPPRAWAKFVIYGVSDN